MGSPEQWKGRIDVKRSDAFIQLNLLGDQNSHLLCKYEPANKLWEIEDISVVSQNKGVGKALVSELVNQLGLNQNVFAYVIEPDSIERILKAGWAKQAKSASLPIDREEDLQTIKFVRVMQGGGMKTTKCVVSWLPYEKTGHTLKDIEDLRRHQNPILSGEKILTLEWYGKTPQINSATIRIWKDLLDQ